MAQIRFDIAGNITQYFPTEDLLACDLAARKGNFTIDNTTSTISFDENTNLILAKDISDNIKAYTNSAGVLKKSGVIVNINTASQDYQDLLNLATLKAILDPTAGAINLAQAKVMFRIIFKVLNKQGLL